ncbi:hypothetical protein [Noviherbaspirillum sp.]|uniref:hypothetical protein n=1 Tax=Noviherbaspirillum sp. TaxID=1926288 RepID=UPI002FE3CEA7
MSKFARKLLPAVTALALAGAYPVVYGQSSSVSGTGNLKESNPKELTQAGPSAGSRSGDPAEDRAKHSSTSGASGTQGAAGKSGASADTASDDKAIQDLLAAAQSLRESIQTMAQMPAGEKRTEAIREGNEALMQVQAAMASLPPYLLLANAKEADYKKAIDKMKQASDKLYSAADALANQPRGKQSSAAVRQVNKALLETNEAMLTGLQMSAAGSNTSGTGSSGTSAGSSGNGNGGSAAVTGRPGANNVDLSGTAGSASSGSGAGSASTDKEVTANVKGPTKANDIGVMDSPNSRALRGGATEASSTDGKATSGK